MGSTRLIVHLSRLYLSRFQSQIERIQSFLEVIQGFLFRVLHIHHSCVWVFTNIQFLHIIYATLSLVSLAASQKIKKFIQIKLDHIAVKLNGEMVIFF